MQLVTETFNFMLREPGRASLLWVMLISFILMLIWGFIYEKNH